MSQITIRLGSDAAAVAQRVEKLLPRLAREIRAHGGKANRSSLYRLAFYRGLELLEEQTGLAQEEADE